jgi:hypothetical protein
MVLVGTWSVVVSTALTDLFTGLFDDAALYPPAATELPDAVRSHAAYRLSWYADMVGPFVCNGVRLRALDEQVRAVGLTSIDVSMVVPEGIDGLDAALETMHQCERLRLRAVEVPLESYRREDALRRLTPIREYANVYVEIPVLSVTERHVHELCAAGLRLKLRTGGTSIDTFRTEAELASPILMCAAERLAFKCTAGLHNAVRHRDPETLFEHHGFLNIALAARIAASTGSPGGTAAALAERNPSAVAYRVGELDTADIAAIRALFMSFGTCSITDPIADLLSLGLVNRP